MFLTVYSPVSMETPMTSLPELSELSRQRRNIHDQLAALGDLRPGSLTPRYRKCGKPTCHCAREGDPGHGPSWSLTWTVEGKTRTRIIPAEAVEDTQAQIAEYRRARSLTRELFEVSTRMCDVQLEALKATQKKTSLRRSSRNSAARSPPKPRA